MRRTHVMPFGAQLDSAGCTRFRLWAPTTKRVVLKTRCPPSAGLQADMDALQDGWYELSVEGLGAGTRYVYRIDDEIDVPDPAARFNPQGVHAESLVVDPTAFEWRDDSWRGRPHEELAIYEMHVGAFTPEGTYAAIVPTLDDLARLGVTAIELLPVATFAGQRGWGYDGVLCYAPHPSYGTPEELKHFVQCAHERKLCVLLDVVYNHFGPEGNYLGRYAKDFFTSKHRTPWGESIDFSKAAVRQFFIQNALYWVNEYHLDGLRIDAVHAMYDDSPRHFIDELVDAVQDGPGRERHVHIILEDHRNESRRLGRRNVSQWNDDLHHALHVLLTGESESYYADYADRPLERLGRTLAEGFAYQGERSSCSGTNRGEPSAHLSPSAFVSFLQNHDQIGNRALGERIAQLTRPEPLRAAFAIVLLAPQVPMLFMGEEYAAAQPFFYFCDYTGELAAAVRDGRRAEFAGFGAFSDEALRETIPDPNAEETLERSRLCWSDRMKSPHAQWLEYVSTLLGIRANRIVPLIARIMPGRSEYRIERGLLKVDWPTETGPTLCLMCNLSDEPAQAASGTSARELIFATSADPRTEQSRGEAFAPWEVRVFVREQGS